MGSACSSKERWRCCFWPGAGESVRSLALGECMASSSTVHRAVPLRLPLFSSSWGSCRWDWLRSFCQTCSERRLQVLSLADGVRRMDELLDRFFSDH